MIVKIFVSLKYNICFLVCMYIFFYKFYYYGYGMFYMYFYIIMLVFICICIYFNVIFLDGLGIWNLNSYFKKCYIG